AHTTGGELIGVETLDGYGFAIDGAGQDVGYFADLYLDNVFRRPRPVSNYQCRIGGITVHVPPGTTRRITMALGWYHHGPATIGRSTAFAYTRHFTDLAAVCRHALTRAPAWIARAEADDAALRDSGLNADRRFLIAKSVRSYWGNSQLLCQGDELRWVVNEGSCNMMNTLDLTVDMAFFEAQAHPWLLRDVLDRCVEEYSYHDQVHGPGDGSRLHPGGISFTHDHGYRDAFAPAGYSQYETSDHPACFSYMTCEELLNWILCSACYLHATDDRAWLCRRRGIIEQCLVSLLNRDHHDPDRRRGLMQFDSSRCGAESEITTYDSLDPSLGQARNNAYIATKYWAAALALARCFDTLGDQPRAAAARASAARSATTLTAAWNEDLGYIPAILEQDDRSAIIPVIEALVYPLACGDHAALAADGPYAAMLERLSRHLQAVLQPGRCLFPDGGWKLSGNNDNSWMSKIVICQHVAEQVFDLHDQQTADRAHAHWWHTGARGQSVVDQVVGGRSPGRGSTYPRTASTWLWWPGMPVSPTGSD
ncbi:MAG: glycoside hydrolase family 52 protein, partial [Planctomycetota bacterium]